MKHTAQVTEDVLQALIAKYRNKFVTRFPKLQLTVHFTPNGQPPTPEEVRTTPETREVSGLFAKVGRDYRIGINQNSPLHIKLLTFFHEYGHAIYRRQANEAIDNTDALIRTETEALLSSLRLSDEEGLPDIAYLAVNAARVAALTDPVYQTAMENATTDPLWQKYSKQN